MNERSQGAWLNSPVPPLKEVLLLFGWLHTWDPNYDGDVENYLGKYETIIYPILKSVANENILNISLTPETQNKIEVVFNEIATCGRPNKYGKIKFESTDTSKILHAIIPELFVMWDTGIRNAIIGYRGTGGEYRGDCYAKEFLPKMQERSKIFLNSFVNQHGGDYINAAKQVSALANGVTIAKLIDELNYLMFTNSRKKRRTIEVIRQESL